LEERFEIVVQVLRRTFGNCRSPLYTMTVDHMINNSIKINKTNTNNNNRAASKDVKATIALFDAPRKWRRLHYVVFLGIVLTFLHEIGQIMTTSKTMWEASAVVNKKLLTREKGDEVTIDENYSKILAELLPDLPAELHIENIQDHTRRNHFAHLASVHLSDTPSRAAGRWVKQPPSLATRASPELLQCLAEEKQGNCYTDDDKNETEDSLKYKASRIRLVVKDSLNNSAGILKGYDPYVWESHDEAYAVFPPGNGTSELRQALKGRRIIIVGDSLSRQWAQSLKCELKHVYGYDTVDVQYCKAHDMREFAGGKLKECLRRAKRATLRDYVVFNFGHHQDPGKPKIGPRWRQAYKALMLRVLPDLKTWLGHLPPSHVIFRTTSVRHFLAGKGDWNSTLAQAGGLEASMDAKWDHYGGQYISQPIQNLLGISMVGANSNFSIMDVSPLTLARADSTFDGTHFCMPGPIEEWTRMLFYRIVQSEKETTDKM
jgi:hypothetical protein